MCQDQRTYWSPFGGVKFHVCLFFHRIQDDGMFAKSDIPEKKCWESQLARSGLSITLRATPPGGWACPWTVITDAFQGVSPWNWKRHSFPKFQQRRETQRLEALKVDRQNSEPLRTGPTQRAWESCRQCWGNWAPIYESWKLRIVSAKGSSQFGRCHLEVLQSNSYQGDFCRLDTGLSQSCKCPTSLRWDWFFLVGSGVDTAWYNLFWDDRL